MEFFNVAQLGANGQLDSSSYEQSARSKTSTILGFYWTSPTEIVYLTTHGIELYNVVAEKKQVKMGRYLNQLITWFVFCPHSCQLVISTSRSTKSVFVFYLKNGTIYKLPKIEIDLPTASALEIKEKDVQILTNYEVSYVAVVMHPEDASASSNSEIILYNINKDASTVTKTHRLRTTFNGISGLALHSIDDVLLVHNKKRGETFFFDIGLSGEYDGGTYHHTAVGKPCKMIAEAGEYPTHWVVFAPDIIIDANSGNMWHLRLKIEAMKVDDDEEEEDLCQHDLPRHISFMLQRQNAKRAILDSLLSCCIHPNIDLTSLGASFDRINREYRLYIDQQLAPNLALPASTFSSPAANQSNLNKGQKPSKVILDQADIYTNILSPLLEMATLDRSVTIKKVIAIVIEYLRSLEERQIPAQHFLHELLINLLVRSGQYYQLHQLLQYHIISDSKPLACLLLSLEAAYPAAFQLSMDMLSRLKTSQEEIVEILLSKKKVISALMYAKSHGLERSIQAKKFLQAAKDASADKSILVSTRNWLDEQNLLSAKDAHDYQ